MTYTSGMLNKRITFARRIEAKDGQFGRGSAGIVYTLIGGTWAAVDFNRGVKSLREGAIDAYDTVMFRLRWHDSLDRFNIINYQGKWYEIESFNKDFHDNTIQITAHEMANQNIIIGNQ